MRKRLVIALGAALLLGLGTFFRHAFLLPSTPTPHVLPVSSSSTEGTRANRLSWNGAEWYLHGVNVPWYHWGCDFGCNATNGKTGGVSTNMAVLAAGFAEMKQAGMQVA